MCPPEKPYKEMVDMGMGPEIVCVQDEDVSGASKTWVPPPPSPPDSANVEQLIIYALWLTYLKNVDVEMH